MADQGEIDSATAARSPEQALVDHMERIAHDRGGHFAIQLNLSKLKPANRQAYHIRIASRSFDGLLQSAKAQLYVLTSSDIVLVCQDMRIGQVDVIIEKVRALFRGDPLARDDDGQGFSRWYDLDAEYEEFVNTIKTTARLIQLRKQKSAEDASAGRGRTAAMAGQPLDTFALAKVGDALSRLRITDFMRRQSAVIIGADGTERILFRENFVSIGDLQRRIAPGFNLVSDLWLFQYLTQIIDKRVLAAMARFDFAGATENISLNLNISTVLGPDFQNFHARAGRHAAKIVVEFQVIDVFSDMGAYTYARDWLRENGFRVLLDGLTPLSMSFFDPGLLDPDFVKVAWGTDLGGRDSIEDHADRMDLIEGIGKEKFILARTDSEDAVKWALALGIRRFQGRFMDLLIARQMEKGGPGPAPA